MKPHTSTPHVCAVIPPHILRHAAEHGDERARITLESTLQYSSLIAGRRRHGLFALPQTGGSGLVKRNVYTARGRRDLPGQLVMSDTNHPSPLAPRPSTLDPDAIEAFRGSGVTYDFYSSVFGRHSIDDRGMLLESTIHYGHQFDNALWNGQQMIYGDGDGKLFNRFTGSLEVIAHELTHGVTQYTARLAYDGQSGALSEHISDAFGIMVRQHAFGQSANDSNWLIGAELLAQCVSGKAIRSMAAPGTAYDDPMLGQDPQVAHMKDYNDSPFDNGGVHLNSGIPNRAFYLIAVALGGNSWETAGKIWYNVLTTRLNSGSQFQDFAEATVAEAGELTGQGSKTQHIVAEAWAEVGLSIKAVAKRALPTVFVVCDSPFSSDVDCPSLPFGTLSPNEESLTGEQHERGEGQRSCGCVMCSGATALERSATESSATESSKCARCVPFKAGKDLHGATKFPWSRKDPHRYYDLLPCGNVVTRKRNRRLAKRLRMLIKRTLGNR